MTAGPELPMIEFPDGQAWAAWLERHHASSDGVWVMLAKKGSGIKTVTYAEAVEAALCYGWIDGQVARYDERYYLQRFTPRRSRSRWSRINREKAERLIAQRRMKPAGHAQITAAKADGRWEAAYPSPSNAAVPEDLRRALEEEPEARAFFETLNASERYAVLYRVLEAKRPETRSKRIAQYVEMLGEHRVPGR